MQILMITLDTMVNIDNNASPVEKRFESYHLASAKTRINQLSASKLVLEQDMIGFKSENKIGNPVLASERIWTDCQMAKKTFVVNVETNKKCFEQ